MLIHNASSWNNIVKKADFNNKGVGKMEFKLFDGWGDDEFNGVGFVGIFKTLRLKM